MLMNLKGKEARKIFKISGILPNFINFPIKNFPNERAENKKQSEKNKILKK